MNWQRSEVLWEENYQEKNNTSDWNISSNEAFWEASIWQLNRNVELKWLKHKVFSQAKIHRNNFCFHPRWNNRDRIYLLALNYYKAIQNIWNRNFQTFSNRVRVSEKANVVNPNNCPSLLPRVSRMQRRERDPNKAWQSSWVNEIGLRIWGWGWVPLAGIHRIRYREEGSVGTPLKFSASNNKYMHVRNLAIARGEKTVKRNS